MKYPFTLNTLEIREFLEEEGFKPLVNYQEKKYIFPLINDYGSLDGTWKQYIYLTTDVVKDLNFLEAKKSSISRFKSIIKTLKNE